MANKTKKHFYVEVAGQKVKVMYEDLKARSCLALFIREPELIIKLCSSMDKKQEKRILMHEMFHVLLHVTGCGNNLAMAEEEAIVLALEYNALKIIKQSHSNRR